MGRVADLVTMQSRTLNLGKGPAVHSKRVQADRMKYHAIMKQTLEAQENLRVIQGEIVKVGVTDGALSSVTTRLGARYEVKAAIICSGTYLRGRVIVGDTAYASGPDGSLPSVGLNECLAELGIKLLRFKTGTPPRIHRRSIDFSKLERQDGEEKALPFSHRSIANEKEPSIAPVNAETGSSGVSGMASSDSSKAVTSFSVTLHERISIISAPDIVSVSFFGS